MLSLATVDALVEIDSLTDSDTLFLTDADVEASSEDTVLALADASALAFMLSDPEVLSLAADADALSLAAASDSDFSVLALAEAFPLASALAAVDALALPDTASLSDVVSKALVLAIVDAASLALAAALADSDAVDAYKDKEAIALCDWSYSLKKLSLNDVSPINTLPSVFPLNLFEKVYVVCPNPRLTVNPF
jgi:hypothetical protein